MKIVNIFVIITTLVGFGIVGAMAITGVRTATSISIGSVNTQASGSSESFSIPISLKNPGPLSLNGISVAITITDVNGTNLSSGGGGPISLPPGSSGQLPINVSFDLSQVPESTLQTLATTNENLTLRAVLDASVSSITSISVTINTAYQWGAPVSNLQLGAISTSAYNATSAQFTMPFNFTDNSQSFSVSGTVAGVIIGQSGSTAGTVSPMNLNVGPDTFFSGQLSGYIAQSTLKQKSVRIQLTFQTSFGTFTENFVENA